jgi:hypothetical protein
MTLDEFLSAKMNVPNDMVIPFSRLENYRSTSLVKNNPSVGP